MIRSNDKTYEQRKRCMSLTISSVSFFTKHFMSVKSIKQLSALKAYQNWWISQSCWQDHIYEWLRYLCQRNIRLDLRCPSGVPRHVSWVPWAEWSQGSRQRPEPDICRIWNFKNVQLKKHTNPNEYLLSANENEIITHTSPK